MTRRSPSNSCSLMNWGCSPESGAGSAQLVGYNSACPYLLGRKTNANWHSAVEKPVDPLSLAYYLKVARDGPEQRDSPWQLTVWGFTGES